MTSEEAQQIVRAAMAHQADGDVESAARRLDALDAEWLCGITPRYFVSRWEKLWDDFAGGQHARAELVCMARLAEGYARENGNELVEGYKKLGEALRRGEFDQNGKPYVLYAVRGAAWHRLTKQKFEALPKGDVHPGLELAHCWVLREHGRRWLKAELPTRPEWLEETEPSPSVAPPPSVDALGTASSSSESCGPAQKGKGPAIIEADEAQVEVESAGDAVKRRRRGPRPEATDRIAALMREDYRGDLASLDNEKLDVLLLRYGHSHYTISKARDQVLDQELQKNSEKLRKLANPKK
ncbi:MAG TPA: hypothetical protein VFL96_09435 [Acidobacteriaceae bacterium]|nr:hypothetical protein [Acidobacteriaceae bacterium]